MPISESRAGKKIIIYGSSVAIVGLVLLGGVLLIWSAIQDLPRTPENIANDVVATGTHAEDEVETIAANEEENLEKINPITRSEVLAYLNLFSESVTKMKTTVESGDARGFLQALEGLQQTADKSRNKEWKIRLKAYFILRIEELGGMEELANKDMELSAELNYAAKSKNKLFRYLGASRVDEDVRFRKKQNILFEELDTKPKWFIRFQKIDIEQIRSLTFDLL